MKCLFSVIGCLAFLVLINNMRAGEKPIAKKNIPAAVLSSFQQRYPNAKIVGQSKEVKGKIVNYEIESMDSTISRNVLFQPDGTLVEVEESIREEDLPAVVRQAVKDKYPSARVDRVESVTRDKHVEYELVLKNGKRSISVVVNSAGKIFKIQ